MSDPKKIDATVKHSIGGDPSAPSTTSDPTPGAALPTHQTETPAHPLVDHNGHVKDRNRSTL
jgi:hypothetical protein